MIKDKIELSEEFKKQTTKAILSIVLFAVVYLILIALAVLLTIVCVYAGIMIIVTVPRFITIVLGIGLASLGVLVLIFLLKFIFKSNKVDRSHLTEITQKDEPELFKMIDEIVNEVGTHFPKKVYLSSDVNASVFYDSSFWSMFFPIKKNLQIGLGLVNSISKEELKAILAHEFGHFSQRTMKVGSYVYNVNKVIHNMLYDNNSYENLIQGWANISGYFSIFVVVAINIIEAIQWILQKMYGVVNLSYMGLSREMEFQADEIAANVTGYLPLKNSLLRLDLAQHSYQTVLNYYSAKINDNIKSNNIYKEQAFVMNFLAQESQLEIKNQFPQVSLESMNKYNKSKLVIKDQWASHPSVEDRIERLEQLNLINENEDFTPSNKVFKNIEETQQLLTDKLFKQVTYKGETSNNSLNQFISNYQSEFVSNSFNKIYKGYYDNKNIIPFEVDEIRESKDNLQFEDIYSEAKIDLVYAAVSLQNDLNAIEQIAKKEYNVKSYDYDGKKYKQKDSRKLLVDLNAELKKVNETIAQNDILVYQFFKKQETLQNKSPKLAAMYKEFFAFDKAFEKKESVYVDLSKCLDFINYTTPFEQIKSNFKFVDGYEVQLKSLIREMMENEIYKDEMNEAMRTNFELYTSKKLTYFDSQAYMDDNLQILFTALNDYYYLLSKGYFLLKKNLLEYQASL